MEPPSISSDQQPPIQALTVKGCSLNAVKFYRGVDWISWWHEFSSSINVNGRVKYQTAQEFSKAKGKTTRECNLIYAMIGPRADWGKSDGRRIRAPRLGDWETARTAQWSSEECPRTDAAQEFDGALRNVESLCLMWLERWQRFALKIDEAFTGEPFLPNLAPTAPANRARIRAYFTMHRRADQCFYRGVDIWLAIHGMLPSQIKASLASEPQHPTPAPELFVDQTTAADRYIASELRKNT